MAVRQADARYLRALREHWVYIAVTLALAVGGALAYTQAAEPRYEANADILVSPVTSDTLVGLPVLRENLFGRSVVTAARLTKSPQVAARVRERLQLDLPLSSVSNLVTVTPQEQSDIVTITGNSASPAEAAKLANAFARALLAERTERFQQQLDRVMDRLSARLAGPQGRPGTSEAGALSARLADLRALSDEADPTLEIVSAAVAPSLPASPRPLLAVGVAGVIGLLLGIGIALALETVNPLVMRAEFTSERDAPPILARMPRLPDGDVQAVVSGREDVPPEIRASMRTLWANLGSIAPKPSQARTLLVTSVDTGEGAPALTALFSVLMARASMTVALIDADLQQAPLAGLFDRHDPSVERLGQALAARTSSANSNSDLAPAPSRPLRVLVAGAAERDLTEWLPPERLAELVADLKHEVDVILVSAPPPSAAETTVLTEVADAVIVTVAVGRTRRDRLNQLRDDLANRGVVPAGFVVLERPSLLTRVVRVPTKASVQRRWAPR